jgi:metallo-beta-lactamase family protein
MKFIPHGAAREVTGTCHELQVGNKRILLDCGLFQGHRREAAEKNGKFSFDPKDIDAVILSHAHMDHAGRIPFLWKRGYEGPIFCTYATKDLSAVMLRDGGYIQEKDEEYFRKRLGKKGLYSDGPLYTQQDAIDCMELFAGVNYNEWFAVCEGVRAMLLDAGHILGAAMIILEATENGATTRIGFSGDLGRSMLPILRDPSVMPPVDVLICESTYGDRDHEDIGLARDHLKTVVTDTAKRGGKVIIPAFSLERTQEIVYDLHVLWDAKEIPAVPIIIDSPLASSVTDVFMRHPECYDPEMFERFIAKQHNPFQFSLVRYTDSPEESKALNGTPGPMIIMAASGMCEAGRIRHHLRNEPSDPRNAILIVGFVAENTLGRRIIDPGISEVKIFDQKIAKRAQVIVVDAFSAHAGATDLDAFVGAQSGLRQLILVHGEAGQMGAFAQRITEKLHISVLQPVLEEHVQLG